MGADIAEQIAREGYDGEVDRLGRPLIDHALAVARRLSDEPERVAGILHDLLEDTGWTADDLRARGAPERCIRAVEIVTRREDETYAEFIERIATAGGPEGELARAVKLADLAENLSRVRQLPAGEANRLEHRYRYAIAVLSPLASLPSARPAGA